MKILLAVDGSDISLRAVKHVIALSKQLAKPPQVILGNVDVPLLQRVAVTLGAQGVARYHAENAEAMCGKVRRMLRRAGLAFEEEIHVGDVADVLLGIAKKRRVDLIVMGSHGNGPLRGMFLGSVSAKVISHTTLPVTIVR
ncbi:universal stress protein [Lysobacter niastensis]|uniref:Universal stress protein n=1 Tax=Lysobacter niastensis TaxID=380629 RepID=A0ABS0BA38_9GAMM|nr:universal stress protein [Lysobacter niastensis]MBF6024682.1 universal stress protein [Lysobacter niastensis]